MIDPICMVRMIRCIMCVIFIFCMNQHDSYNLYDSHELYVMICIICMTNKNRRQLSGGQIRGREDEVLDKQGEHPVHRGHRSLQHWVSAGCTPKYCTIHKTSETLLIPKSLSVAKGVPRRSTLRNRRDATNSKVPWVPQFESAEDKSVRGLRAVKSAYSAYTESCILPTRDRSNASLRALASACRGAL